MGSAIVWVGGGGVIVMPPAATWLDYTDSQGMVTLLTNSYVTSLISFKPPIMQKHDILHDINNLINPTYVN